MYESLPIPPSFPFSRLHFLGFSFLSVSDLQLQLAPLRFLQSLVLFDLAGTSPMLLLLQFPVSSASLSAFDSDRNLLTSSCQSHYILCAERDRKLQEKNELLMLGRKVLLVPRDLVAVAG